MISGKTWYPAGSTKERGAGVKRTLTEKQKKTLSLAAVAIFILLSLALAWFVGRPLIRFARQPEQFRAWVEGHGLWAPLAYAAMVFLQVVVAVIPGEPLEIAGGYAFGAWQGTALCLAGAVLGSVAVFALVRRWGRGLVEVFFPADKLLLSGDTLFAGSVGRTDFPGGSMARMMDSLQALMKLPDDTLVIPGHGGHTTIGDEKRTNPYIV